MKSQPLVSVLVSAYHAEKYIKESIDSALNQTYKNIEVIVIDDDPKDQTPEIMRNYHDSRLHYIPQVPRIGILKTRNKLLHEAKGEYVAYLDSDDIWLPTKLDEQVNFLESHPDYDAVYSNLAYFFNDKPGTFYHHSYAFYSGDIFEKLLDRQFITNSALIFRKSVIDRIGHYDETLGMVEDWPYFLKMAHAGMKFKFLDKDLVHYRLRWDNNTNFANQLAIQLSAVNAFEKLSKAMTKEEFVRYNMGKHLLERRMRLLLIELVCGKRGDAWKTWRETKMNFLMRTASAVALSFFALIPTALLRKMVEMAWKRKKKNLFVPLQTN